MTTLTKIIVTTLLSLMLCSCNFDFNLNTGVAGNGNVTKENRGVTNTFNAIKASEGLDVYLNQSHNENIIVEADNNLHELIITEVVNGVLKIHTSKNIGRATSKKVIVNFKNISKISSSSGSDVYANKVINANHLELSTSSGSDMELEVNASVINCKSSSGSDLRLSGQTEKLIAQASSGSDINAGNLKAQSSQVKASSGADIVVNTSKELVAQASSGGDIKYYGNPIKVDKNNSSSGSVKKK
ncbi:hypothetical protein GCM10022291_34340 [Postechiella marina]|uniref:Putative auto-transporter adhesin head GIN domain-containing protein n=1 Tax=Postechiella marina TaxID=943941 RepID=A0ABP8CI20_9FLAO